MWVMEEAICSNYSHQTAPIAHITQIYNNITLFLKDKNAVIVMYNVAMSVCEDWVKL